MLWIGRAPLQLGDLGGDQVLGLWITLFLSLMGARVLARGRARHTTPPERCLLLGDPEACERARKKINGSHTVNAEVVAADHLRPDRRGGGPAGRAGERG